MFAAIETGGAKFLVAVATGPEDLREERRIPTTTPQETLERTTAHLLDCQEKHGQLAAIGIGTFGPAGVNPRAADYGFITTTPKPGWQQTNVVGHLRRHFPGIPIAFDTDVNAAGFGECRWGAGRGSDVVLYLTVGTGIGGGLIVNNRPLHGLLHPEMGHIRIPHDRSADPFPGCCPWHEDCLEGLACGLAMKKRWNQPAETLPADHPAWDLEAHYLALACANFLCSHSPQKLILGGGVLAQPGLLEAVRRKTREILNGYLQHPSLDTLETVIVAPGLGHRSGLLGALALGMDAAKQ